ncbi:MAG: tail fiber domain-containing protein [Steroidobacteraceae bacterium]|jgi:hypothetical protein
MISNRQLTTILLPCVLAALTSGAARASQPPDSVTSDASGNTAMGQLALYKLDSPNCASGIACYNTAAGAGSLYDNTAGEENTAFGFQSLNTNGTGSSNTASGYRALATNSDGSNNSAFGTLALYGNTTGSENAAFGQQSLNFNTEGVGNTAIGHFTLDNNSTGSYNTALGWYAGTNITGADNVDIANFGESSDYGVIRIGTAGQQTSTYISGISTSKITGNAVYVTASGRLGVLASSERYKTRISTMGGKTDKLQLLRPVTFHLKSEPKGDVQYGLIAEEVVKVYPELVIRDDAGIIQGVRYDELAPMLLNEMQKQQITLKAQGVKLAEIEELRLQIAELKQQTQVMQAQLRNSQHEKQLLAQR